jgi:hypothetical protein
MRTEGRDAATAANGGARGSDSLTGLVTHGPLATKRITPGPVIHPYDDAKTFAVHEVAVSGIHTLAQALERLQDRPRAFVVRGAPAPGIDRKSTRRIARQHFDTATGEVLEPTFIAQPRRWLAVDFDTLPLPTAFDWHDGELSALYLIRHLPKEFAGRSCVWTFTSGAGFKPELRMRLWFWLDRPMSEAEASRWLAGCPVDMSLYRVVQPHYTAAPILEDVPPPVPQRIGLLEDFFDPVPVPALAEPAPPPRPEPGSPRRRQEPGARPNRHYALAALASEAERIAQTDPGQGVGHGRHAALFTGALRMTRFIHAGTLSCAEVTNDLITAAQLAGLSDSWDELVRTVSNAVTTAGTEP